MSMGGKCPDTGQVGRLYRILMNRRRRRRLAVRTTGAPRYVVAMLYGDGAERSAKLERCSRLITSSPTVFRR